MKVSRILLIAAIIAASFGTAAAITAREEIRQNPALCGSNYTVYQDSVLPALTPAPKGYEPFYISTYARHGSRYLCGMNEYDDPINRLEAIERSGKLSAKGKQLIEDLKGVRARAVDRCGDLTDVGAEQHQRIARRMLQNFPQVFAGADCRIDAKSSVVIRCVLSMLNQIKEIQAYNPMAEITTDASGADIWWVAWGANSALGKLREQARDKTFDFKRSRVDTKRFISEITTDPAWAADSLDAYSLMRDLFMVATIQQSHKDGREDLMDIFTNDELYSIWEGENAQHYVEYSMSPISGGIMPFAEVQLLRDFIARADTRMDGGDHNADLRFGHEVILMPLATIMELGHTADLIDDLADVADVWRNYRIFPMAGNIQWIFYRPVDGGEGPIIVKALLNEHEMTMPVKPFQPGFYPWEQLRNHYLNKLDTFEAANPGLVRHSNAD